VVRNALVIGAELISPFMDWSDRDVAVLFGDGAAAVVLEAATARRRARRKARLRWRRARDPARAGHGGRYANRGVLYGITRWQFEARKSSSAPCRHERRL